MISTASQYEVERTLTLEVFVAGLAVHEETLTDDDARLLYHGLALKQLAVRLELLCQSGARPLG